MKKYLVTIAGLLTVVGVIAAIKVSQITTLFNAFSAMEIPPTVISATSVMEQEWEVALTSVGSLESVQGVTVTADIPGRVTEILFTAGAEVSAGEPLIRQDISSEEAQLRAAEASVSLAKANLDRTGALFRKQVSSKAELDVAQANYDGAVAEADNIRTSIDKKTVRAPFAGRLGIRLVNVGSDLGTGSPIVSLQAVDPIYVNFSLPQRDLPRLQTDLQVRIETDAVPDKVFTGHISAINPEIDPATRSVRLQATLTNELRQLLPGMYARVSVVLPEVDKVLIVPTTSIAYATYGDSIFKVIKEKDAVTGELRQVARQEFVRLGETRGDYVSILVGAAAGETVVSMGVFKLRNGVTIAINNDAQPEFNIEPKPKDS